jgi:hypothetical protein
VCQVGGGGRKRINNGSIPSLWNEAYFKIYIRHVKHYYACRLIPQNRCVLSGGGFAVVDSAGDNFF